MANKREKVEKNHLLYIRSQNEYYICVSAILELVMYAWRQRAQPEV